MQTIYRYGDYFLLPWIGVAIFFFSSMGTDVIGMGLSRRPSSGNFGAVMIRTPSRLSWLVTCSTSHSLGSTYLRTNFRSMKPCSSGFSSCCPLTTSVLSSIATTWSKQFSTFLEMKIEIARLANCQETFKIRGRSRQLILCNWRVGWDWIIQTYRYFFWFEMRNVETED
jgi:hypothetical protein